jgi:hypothetical protein
MCTFMNGLWYWQFNIHLYVLCGSVEKLQFSALYCVSVDSKHSTQCVKLYSSLTPVSLCGNRISIHCK